MNALIPPVVVYVGLGACLLSLFVASYQQKCSAKVFFILALRLAIGWHFLFEGLHKIHSHYVGPTDWNRPFSSEPYFGLADGPLGPMMRAKIGDPATLIKNRIEPKQVPAKPSSLAPTELCQLVPEAIATEWTAYVLKFAEVYDKSDPSVAKARSDVNESILANYGRWIIGAEAGKEAKIRYVQTDVPYTVPQRLAHLTKLEAAFEELKTRTKPGLGQGTGYDQKHIAASRDEIKTIRADLLADSDSVLTDMKKELFAKSAGKKLSDYPAPSKTLADDAKFKEVLTFTSPGGPASFETSVPPSVRDIWTGYQDVFLAIHPLKDEDKKKANDTASFWKQYLAEWGQSKDGFMKSKAAYETALKSDKKEDVEGAKAALLSEIDKQFATFKSTLNGSLAADTAAGLVAVPKEKPLEQIDWFTRWFITIVGACIFFGLLTRLNCLLAVGFLVMTYLTHPPFPWLPLPPNTEGNPLFINKNVIEALALLVIAVHPTGKWLGLDSLIHRLVFGR